MTSELFERVREVLPGYEVGGEIARGGFGVVLYGTHLRLERKVAIKLLPTEVAHNEDIRGRFAAEARLMAGIDHPHVVPVYDYVEEDDLCLFVMEYLPAGTVLTRFTTKGFHPGPAIGVALACASALEAAHRQGVLHRDVKPANLMFAANGTVKLSDFGIAKIVGGNGGKTRAGDVLGTAWYIAPEQVLGNPVTPATDVYGLATTLYQLLSGTLPFPMDVDGAALYVMHAYSRPIPLAKTAPALPTPIADVVMRGLATDPRMRWRSAEEFGVALASAATRCWGPNWLAQAGVPVLGNDSIKAATAAISNPPIASVHPWTSAPPGPRPPLPASAGASPRAPYLVAGVLAVAAIVLALVGLGSPPRGGDLGPGTVTIAGVDPVTAEYVEIDMTKPIDVTVEGVRGDTVALNQNVLGATFGDSAPLLGDGPVLTAELDPPNPYILAGRMTAELRIADGDNPQKSFQFELRSTQSSVTTAFAGGVLFVGLFAVAYMESYSRILRNGRNEISAKVGLPVAAAILAVAMVGVIWIAVGREPTAATVIGCAAIGAAAGVSGTIASLRHGAANRSLRDGQVIRPARPDGGSRPANGQTPPPASDGATSGRRQGIKGIRGIKTQRD